MDPCNLMTTIPFEGGGGEGCTWRSEGHRSQRRHTGFTVALLDHCRTVTPAAFVSCLRCDQKTTASPSTPAPLPFMLGKRILTGSWAALRYIQLRSLCLKAGVRGAMSTTTSPEEPVAGSRLQCASREYDQNEKGDARIAERPPLCVRC